MASGSNAQAGEKRSCCNCTCVKAFVLKNYLPLGFCVALTLGLALPQPGAWLASFKVAGYKVVQSICIIGIFIVSGLTLKTSEVTAAIKAWLSFLYGIIAILFITPLAGMGIMKIPFAEEAFATGFAVFCCVPTTLTSGVTLATQAGGNSALALMLTVTTNVIGVFTTPLMLSVALAVGGLETDTGAIEFDTANLILKLVITILVPTLVGKIIRESHKRVGEWVASNKVPLGLTNNSLLIIIVWMTISTGRDDILSQDAVTILMVVAVGVGLHCVLLAFNGVSVWALRLATPERKTVHILTSQKTLPVAVTVISFLPPELGSTGLLTIPCIIGHISQLFIDAFLVSSNSFDRPGMFCGPKPDGEFESLPSESINQPSQDGQQQEETTVAEPTAATTQEAVV